MLFTGKGLYDDYHPVNLRRITYGKPESLQVRKSPKYDDKKQVFPEPWRVSLTASGSLTVETAIVLPLVLFFLFSFFSLFSILRTQVQVQMVLAEALEEVGKRTIYRTEVPLTETMINRALLEWQVRQGLEEMEGMSAIDFEGTTVDLERGVVEVSLQYELSVDTIFFFVENLRFRQYAMRKLWTGVDSSALFVSDETFVYVTEHGTVYHSSQECTYLKLSVRAVTVQEVSDVRNAAGGRYYMCELCGTQSKDTVYITTYGERYHSALTCSGLRRRIKMVTLDAVADLAPCSKCSD